MGDKLSNRPLVCFHAGCADGFTAAWIAHGIFGDSADYVPVNYGEPPPNVAGRVCYILDFSYKRDVMKQIIGQAHKVCVLDHHRTAYAELEPFPSCSADEWRSPNGRLYIKFDMERSGGRLAWDFFYRNSGVMRPWIVDYTEDRDLWRWVLPASKEINAALASYPRDFKTWTTFSKWGQESLDFASFVREGAAILRYQAQMVEAACANAVEIEMDGYRVLSTNATMLISEIGERLAKDRPFSATFFIRSDGAKVWSLRSRGEGGVDVSEIARRHGGGGHRAASGYTESLA